MEQHISCNFFIITVKESSAGCFMNNDMIINIRCCFFCSFSAFHLFRCVGHDRKQPSNCLHWKIVQSTLGKESLCFLLHKYTFLPFVTNVLKEKCEKGEEFFSILRNRK